MAAGRPSCTARTSSPPPPRRRGCVRTYRALPQQDSHTAIGYMIVVQIAAGVVLAVWGLSSAAPAAVTNVVAAIVIAGWWCCTDPRSPIVLDANPVPHQRFSRIRQHSPSSSPISRPREGPTGHAGRRRRTGPYSGGHRLKYRRTFWCDRDPSTARIPAVRYLDRTGRDCGPGTEPPLALAPLADCLAQIRHRPALDRRQRRPPPRPRVHPA